MSGEDIGKVIELPIFPEVHKTESFRNLGTEYAQGMADTTIAACMRLELPIEFVPMYEAYLNDLNLIVFDENETRDPKPAMLAVLKMPNGEEEPNYKRAMLISQQEANRRAEELDEAFKAVNIHDVEEADLQRLALDWLFSEMAMAALGAACFMQQRFTKYHEDWDGTNKYDNAHRTISANYLSLNPDEEIETKEDTKRLIKGFGIMMIHNAIIAHGVVGNATQANWVVEQLRRTYPEAYRWQEITDRLSAVKPSKDLKKEIAAYALTIYDPAIDLPDDPSMP